MGRVMQAMRIVAAGLAWAGLLGGGIARAGIETFDGTGLTNAAWVAAGSFTGGVSGVATTQPAPVTDVPVFMGTTGANLMSTMIPFLRQFR